MPRLHGRPESNEQIAMRFSDHFGELSQDVSRNPNGSPGGLTAVTSEDGRVLGMMPHPERVFRTSSIFMASG